DVIRLRPPVIGWRRDTVEVAHFLDGVAELGHVPVDAAGLTIEPEVLLGRNPRRRAVMHRAPADDLVGLTGVAVGPLVLTAVFRPLAVGNIRDHPAADRLPDAGRDRRVSDGPVVAAFDHRDAQTIARFRIDSAFGDAAGNDTTRGAAADDQHVVVILAVGGLD